MFARSDAQLPRKYDRAESELFQTIGYSGQPLCCCSLSPSTRTTVAPMWSGTGGLPSPVATWASSRGHHSSVSA